MALSLQENPNMQRITFRSSKKLCLTLKVMSVYWEGLVGGLSALGHTISQLPEKPPGLISLLSYLSIELNSNSSMTHTRGNTFDWKMPNTHTNRCLLVKPFNTHQRCSDFHPSSVASWILASEDPENINLLGCELSHIQSPMSQHQAPGFL